MSYFSGYPAHSLFDISSEYDYIILGGGTAGCVIANRLSKAGFTTLLVERGGVGDSWISWVPLFSPAWVKPTSRVTSFNSVPQKQADNRTFNVLVGNSLGGGSKINAMLYTRGLPAEYNAWSKAGRKGWSYDDLRGYFARSETDLDQKPDEQDGYHGIHGEWKNRSHKDSFWRHTAYITAATANLGIPYIEDLNSPAQPAQGCAKMHYNIDGQGYRSSTFSAFLPRKLVKERQAILHVCTNTATVKIQTEGEGQALRARSVLLRSTNKKLPDHIVRARCEIILCAGALKSPQILMLSGIGPEEHLKEHGIPVVKNLPAVGNNLQDHVAVPLQYRVPTEDSMVKFQLQPWKIIIEIILYLLWGTGLLLGPALELSVFAQSRHLNDKFKQVTTLKDRDASLPENLPDIEIMAIANAEPTALKADGLGGLSLFVATLRPTSKGSVKLANRDPFDDPLVDVNSFATENDWEVMRKGIKLGMHIGQEMAALGYDISGLFLPQSLSDSDIDRFIREQCRTSTHFSSTCRMAPENGAAGGVVDDRLCVHGIRGLRVADASIFPEVLSTHLAAPTVVVAEKCADMIVEDHGVS